MSRADFIGRSIELGLLDSLWESDKANLLILYGRRRVGKTRLLIHWLHQQPKRALYWTAEPTSAAEQLRSFSQALYNFVTPDSPAPLDFTYANWEQALRQVALLAQNSRLAIFIDEVTYLIDVNPAIMGAFQKAWDQWLSKSNLFLALSGSQMGMMQAQILSYEAPLYGRSTAHIRLLPLPFGTMEQFFPDYTPAERIATYAIWGGIPAYWERINSDVSVMENVRVQLLPSNAMMQEEPRILLQDFINDPHNYVGILRAIASSSHTQSEICDFTGLSRGLVSRYLSVLRETGFVEREIPVTETSTDSRRGRYFITDPYLRFYYRFLAAYQARLALGEQEQMLTSIEGHLPQFIETYTWTDLCQEWVLRAAARNELPLTVEDVGGAWTRSQTLEVVGIDHVEKNIVLGVTQWADAPAGAELIHSLASRANAIVPRNEVWSLYCLGFSYAGWTEKATAQADEILRTSLNHDKWRYAGSRLLDLADVAHDLTRWTTSTN